MRKLFAGTLVFAVALGACDDTDPLGTTPDSEMEATYARAVADVRAVPRVVVHPAPEGQRLAGGEGIPLAAASVSGKRTEIVNGSFETGDFAGWTTVTTGSPFIPWLVSGPGDGAGFDMAPTQPQDGSYVAWNGFDGEGPMEFEAYQDIEIGSGVPTLTWMDRAQWNYFVFAQTQPRIATVEVRDPATDAVLETLSTFSTGIADGLGDSGWQEHTADLSAYRGQTVRLAFKQSIPEPFTGPGQYELDGVTFDGKGSGGAKLLQSALVLNPGESTPAGFCTFAGRVASQATFVRKPRGGGTLNCQWDEFFFPDELEGALVIPDVGCFLNFGGITTTTDSGRFVLTPAKTATFTCQFENLV